MEFAKLLKNCLFIKQCYAFKKSLEIHTSSGKILE